MYTLTACSETESSWTGLLLRPPFVDGWGSQTAAVPGSPWAARDKYEAVKEHIVTLSMQKQAELAAQQRVAVRAARVGPKLQVTI